MGIEVIWALGLFGMLLLVFSLNGIKRYFNGSKYNTHITFDKNIF